MSCYPLVDDKVSCQIYTSFIFNYSVLQLKYTITACRCKMDIFWENNFYLEIWLDIGVFYDVLQWCFSIFFIDLCLFYYEMFAFYYLQISFTYIMIWKRTTILCLIYIYIYIYIYTVYIKQSDIFIHTYMYKLLRKVLMLLLRKGLFVCKSHLVEYFVI